jgi:hypothetical protein
MSKELEILMLLAYTAHWQVDEKEIDASKSMQFKPASLDA